MIGMHICNVLLNVWNAYLSLLVGLSDCVNCSIMIIFTKISRFSIIYDYNQIKKSKNNIVLIQLKGKFNWTFNWSFTANHVTHLNSLLCESLDATFDIKMAYSLWWVFFINHVNNRHHDYCQDNDYFSIITIIN